MKKTLTISTAIAAALAVGSAAAEHDDEEQEFSEAQIFFELNHTDGDLGIHSKVDGDPWSVMQIFDPRERRILSVRNSGRLRRQGLTEIFFESAEPPFDELAPKTFFRRFPEGTYEIEGRTLDGIELESETQITHLMPAPPETSINGEPQAMQCDDEEPDYDAPSVSGPVVISWDAVTMSHPDAGGAGAGVQPPEPVVIHNYQVVVEAEIDVDGEEFASVLSVILPPDALSLEVPAGFIAMTDSFKYEVLAREESYNQTAVESCFEVE